MQDVLEQATITMDRKEARKRFLEYKHEVQARHDDELAQIMHGYRALSLGQQIIRLGDVLRAGGMRERTRTWRDWDNKPRSETVTLPRLAVMRADRTECWVEVETSGQVVFLPEVWYRGRRDRVVVGMEPSAAVWARQWRAMVPLVPPALRPKAHLRNYHVLWEAEWEYREPPRPPGDPALLKRLSGDLFIVLAVWDLTELERAVLAGRSQ